MNSEQPCFGPSGAVAEVRGLGLEISSPFFGSAQLER
jgi:hypothetical protein